MTLQSSCDRTRFSEVARRVSAAAKAGAIGVLALALFASLLCGPHARAADLFPVGSKATLVFSPTYITAGQQGQLCVTNAGKASLDVTLVLKFLPLKYPTSTQPVIQPRGIEPDRVECIFFDADFDGLLGLFAVASLVLNSPAQCSQATEYPGRCGAVGSLEVFKVNNVEGGPMALTDHIHIEPVLRPASAGLLPPPIVPQ
jgi:hypothetical protein